MNLIFIMVMGIFLLFRPYPLLAAEDIRVIDSDPYSITIELNTSDMKMDKESYNDRIYHKININNYGYMREVGLPQLPVKGQLIGIPSTGGIEIDVIYSDYDLLSGYNIYPAPQRIIDNVQGVKLDFTIDDRAYSTDAFYPDEIVSRGFSGFMRDQRVIQLLFYPVQFNPVRHELRYYKRIVVRLTFEGSFYNKEDTNRHKQGEPVSGNRIIADRKSDTYELLLRSSILNYNTLGR
ncbi:MAG: C25 family peptidase propeptide domain-containing protein [Nitrospirota bacterium]